MSFPSVSMRMSWPLFLNAPLVFNTMQLAFRAFLAIAAISSESGSSEQTAQPPPKRRAITVGRAGTPFAALEAWLARLLAQPVKNGLSPSGGIGPFISTKLSSSMSLACARSLKICVSAFGTAVKRRFASAIRSPERSSSRLSSPSAAS